MILRCSKNPLKPASMVGHFEDGWHLSGSRRIFLADGLQPILTKSYESWEFGASSLSIYLGTDWGKTIWTDDWNHWLDLIACCFMASLSGKVAEFGWNMVKHVYRQLKMVQWHNIHCLGKRNTWPASHRPTELVWCGPIYKAWFNGLALIGVYSTYGGCL